MSDDVKSIPSAGPAPSPAKLTKHEETRARIIAAQALREVEIVAARGPIGSPRRKASDRAASNARPPRGPLGRMAGVRK